MRDFFDHDEAVEETADTLDALGFKVAADHTDEYPDPDARGGRVPDVAAEGPFGDTEFFEVDSNVEASSRDRDQIADIEQATGEDVARLDPFDF